MIQLLIIILSKKKKRWTVWLNTTVHVFMYYYFFLISLGFRISTSWKVCFIFLSFLLLQYSKRNIPIGELKLIIKNYLNNNLLIKMKQKREF